ncbi:MAG: hypothetical protein HY912_17285 [Desulfomonile tiedjei]|uniref:Uncharacterized protein n=1 Tax=Desulfomonile tiedjei TaxID=2358 RepID=A0A9D6V5I9_9BACT|nr:hypothetical protein [Desulfomonile tiedjei]
MVIKQRLAGTFIRQVAIYASEIPQNLTIWMKPEKSYLMRFRVFQAIAEP